MAFEKMSPEEMDKAAAEAEQDLDNHNPDAIEEIGSWMKKHYLRAGYKRLGKILLQHATKKEGE